VGRRLGERLLNELEAMGGALSLAISSLTAKNGSTSRSGSVRTKGIYSITSISACMFEVDWEYAPRISIVVGRFPSQIRDGLCSCMPEISRSIAYALSLSYTPRNHIIHALIIKMFRGITFGGRLER
jgi:hypothetical protein